MKKIFLTSGIIVCMACPAFAGLETGNIDTNNGNVLYNVTDQTTGDPVAANCSYATLDSYTGPVAFEPVWDPETYTVKYYDGQTLLYTDPTQATYGTSYSVNASATSEAEALTASGQDKYGYTFLGWTTDSTPTISSGVLQNPFTSTDFTGLGLDDGDDFNLYAAYKANAHTISFTCGTKPSGATTDIVTGTAIADIDINFGDTYTSNQFAAPTVSECALAGYTFNGWSCDNNVDPVNGGTYGVDGNTTCNATWIANNINLTWYSDTTGTGTVEGTGTGTAAASCSYDGSITLPSTEPSKGGFVFKGWKVTSVRSGN